MKNPFILFYRGLLFATLLLCYSMAQAQRQPPAAEQESEQLKSLLLPESKRGWHHFAAGIVLNLQDPQQFFKQHKQAFELPEGSEMMLVSHTREDALVMNHYKFQQTFNGIPIVGAEYILHHRRDNKGEHLKGNGNIVRRFAKEAKPAISGDAAVQAALAEVGARQYAWQSARHEAMVREQKKDKEATLYPQPRLVYYSATGNPADPAAYQLAYEMKVFALEPMSHKQFYVSAENGSVIRAISLMHETNTPATGTTTYNGVRDITTDFTGGQYVLRETNRAGSGTAISTYDMNNGVDYTLAANYQHTGTTWQHEPVGVQGHWGAEKAFDYYYNVHARKSFDNHSSEIISYLDYNVNYNNAFWNGLYLTFGGGDGVTRTSWAALDAVGHELTHAVTEYSAGLVYLNESGALNESFSDIFGTMVEFSVEGTNGDWLVSEDVTVNGAGIRSMANPNIHDDPDTYHGTFWNFTASDNGGVHTNSGVQNHWFYLLSQGGSGTNDNGNSFTVTGIGKDLAATIAYRNLTFYLTSGSDYRDAREGALEAAEDLQGRTSAAYAQTAMAWYAVGVGYPVYATQDLALRSVSIGGGACQELTLVLENLSTAAIIPAGAVIDVFAIENGVSKPVEQVVLPASLAPGGSTPVTLSQPANQSVNRIHTEVQISYLPDPEPGNNVVVVNVFRGPMTIGGVNPDFTTINAALEALKDPSIITCTSLHFMIRSGQYNGEIRIPSIPVASAERTITFQSETGNADDVILYSLITFNSAFGTVTIDNASHIRLRDLTVVRESSPAAQVSTGLSFRGRVQDIVLDGIKFRSPGTSSFRYNIEFMSFGEAQRDITIRNSIFEQANFGISNGSSVADAALTDHVLIENNTFTGHLGAISRLQGSITLTIRNNKISSSNAGSGISAGASQLLIEGNNLQISGSSVVGIGVSPVPSSTARVINNMISVKSSGGSTAITCGPISKVEILHNTLRQEKTTAGTGSAVSISFTSNLTEKTVLNNILFNTVTGGRGMNLASGAQNVIDHNSFHIPNGGIGVFNGVSYQTLPLWRSASGYDLNSVTALPVFVSDTDLHLASQQLTLKNGKATTVPRDFDGEQRGFPLYIGADEFFSTNDVGVAAVRLAGPGLSCPQKPVQIDVKNFSPVDIFSAGIQIPVSYTINGTGIVHETLTLQQDLLPGQIATYTFTQLPLYFGNSLITARTNRQGDQNPANDAGNLSVNLTGVYTVGGTAPDFSTLQEAIDFVSSQEAFCSDVILKVRPGTYAISLIIGNIPATTHGLHVIVESETGNKDDVVITSNSSAPTISLNAARHLVFRHLTLQYTGASAAAGAIFLENACEDIAIEDCRLSLSSPAPELYLVRMKQGSSLPFPEPNPAQVYGFRAVNNIFEGGGISLYDGFSPESAVNGVNISNNTFEEFYDNAVVLYNASRVVVSGNTISSANFSSGIRIVLARNSIEVEKNRIRLENGTDGVYVVASASPLPEVSVINNFIDLKSGANSVGGIVINGMSGYILHNTVRVAQGTVQPISGEAVVFRNYNSSLRIKNNIFYSTMANAVGVRIFQTGVTTEDFNDIYIPNGNTGDRFNTSIFYKTLAIWRIKTGFDIHGTDVAPVFTSTKDLHLAMQQPDLKLGDDTYGEIPYVETDIDGEQRDVPPYMGADEVTGIIGIIAAGQGEGNQYMTVYPNPAEDNTVVLRGQIETAGSYGVAILDSYGMLRQVQQIPLQTGEMESGVRLNGLAPGIYLLRLTDPSGKVQATVRFEKR